MVKFERKETAKAKSAKQSLVNERQRHGTYNTKEVNIALREMFHEKCYICENKKITSFNIEHLVSHQENEELKFDWNNLF